MLIIAIVLMFGIGFAIVGGVWFAEMIAPDLDLLGSDLDPEDSPLMCDRSTYTAQLRVMADVIENNDTLHIGQPLTIFHCAGTREVVRLMHELGGIWDTGTSASGDPMFERKFGPHSVTLIVNPNGQPAASAAMADITVLRGAA